MPAKMAASPPLIECVPNFSEGRDRAKIDAIVSAMAGVPGVTVLDVDPGMETNRTVVTFVGSPTAVVEGAFRAIQKAAIVIDMQHHSGAHARMGATDVCPFVPISGISEEACVELARTLGSRVGQELGIPVYLYESAATAPHRRNLADIRAGEYEGLAAKMLDPKWKPDFGPHTFNAKAGATVIGVRPFLIAYNINLNTRDARIATDIAATLRESGRPKLGIPGKLKATKGTGWFIPEYQRAQISMNLTDFHVTPPHMAFEAAREEAEKRGVRVTGSELVGLIPLAALVDAGKYFLKKQSRSWGLPESSLIETAIQSLGLRELSPFDPKQKIIEYRLEGRMGHLASLPVHQFLDECSTDSPAPGGGSVAALAASLAAALTGMVANLTQGRKKFASVHEEMLTTADKAQQLKAILLSAVDKDTDAFNAVMEAFKLPKSTPEQELVRVAAIETATLGATHVPLDVLEQMPNVLALAEVVAKRGNPSSRSDAGVAACMARAAAEGAYLNVRTNALTLKNHVKAKDLMKKAEGLLSDVRTRADSVWAVCTTD